MGLRKALEVMGQEEAVFRRHFAVVERITTDTGRSKIILGSERRSQPGETSSGRAHVR
jgi:hypothetical protein